MRAIALLALLGGCATARPAVDVRTVYVDKPIPVACIKGPLPEKPAAGLDRLNGNAVHDLDIMGAAFLRVDAWGDQLVALAKPCVAEGAK